MNLEELQPGVMVPHNDYWFYRDSYNQVWKVRVNSDPYVPLIIELHQKLTEEISPNELFFKRIWKK